MMYRPPEMIDKYRRFNVSTKVDIWVSILKVKMIADLVNSFNRCLAVSLILFASLHIHSPRVRN